ncbi:MAG: laminin B domain-containing protein [Chloroflexota bacterium]
MIRRSLFTLLIGLLISLPISAQTIIDITYDEDILVRLTEQNPTVAYDMSLDIDSTLAVSVRYLGTPFSMTLEIFDEAGEITITETIDSAETLIVSAPAGDNLLLLTAGDGQSGRAVVQFSLSDAQTSENADSDSDTEDSTLVSGEWRVTYGESTTSCPDDLDLDNAWLPADDSVHVLSFSEPPQALEFHAVVAPEEIADAPTFFETEILDDGSVVVIPGIQGQPYTYVYTILTPTQIGLAYTETLTLSDCVLTATILLDLIPDGEEYTATEEEETASVVGWGVDVNGDASDPIFYEDGSVCASDQQSGVTWYFTAPQDFVDQVVDGYGKTLSFELSQDTTGGQYDDVDIIFVVGNGFLLVNDLPANPETEFTPYSIALDETGGWVDEDGMFDTTDPELFQQILSDVTQVQIRGEYSNQADTGCLRNPQVSDS